jgi:hypothetical protein
MKTTLIKRTLRGALAALLVLTFTPLLASGAGKIEGAWNVNVTVRNCMTGQPVASVYRMLTFADDGVIQEFAAFFNPLTPALRSPGLGVWSHLANGNYSYDVQFFRFNPDFTLAGWIRSIGRLWWTDPELPIPLRAPAKSSMSTAICSQTPAQPKQPHVYSDSSTPFHRGDALFHGDLARSIRAKPVYHKQPRYSRGR